MFFSEQFDAKSKLIAVLLFLYPVAGIGVRHWFSGIATALILMGLYIMITKVISGSLKDENYSKEEKQLVFLVALLFISYLISGFVNGWNENQIHYFFREMNFLFFIPLYFAVRSIKGAQEFLIKGTVIAGVFLLVTIINDIYIEPSNSKIRVVGAYNYIFSGPVAVILMFIILSSSKYFIRNRYWKLILALSIIISFAAAILTKSGTAYSLMFLMTIFAPFFMVRELKKRLVIFLCLVAMMLIPFSVSRDVRDGVFRVTDSIGRYLSLGNVADYNGRLGTAGDRLAMWEASWLVFADNVLFGVGRGNYNEAVKEYYAKGEVHKETIRHSHPHNMYFELLVSKGILGAGIFILLIVHILKKYLSSWRNCLRYSEAALTHLLAFLIVGIGSADPLIKNNFMSIFLLYTAVFYSGFNRQKI